MKILIALLLMSSTSLAYATETKSVSEVTELEAAHDTINACVIDAQKTIICEVIKSLEVDVHDFNAFINLNTLVGGTRAQTILLLLIAKRNGLRVVE